MKDYSRTMFYSLQLTKIYKLIYKLLNNLIINFYIINVNLGYTRLILKKFITF